MADEITVDNVSLSSDIKPYFSTKRITEALDEKGYKYDVSIRTKDERPDRIRLTFRTANLPSVTLQVFIREDRISLYAYELMKFKNASAEQQYHVIHTLHSTFTFARWMFDSQDDTIQAEWYGHMTDDIESGRMLARSIVRMASLVDDSYPTLMKLYCETYPEK